MSAGLTIAELVQQVYYMVYKVRLDVTAGELGAYHCHTDKFKEVVMEANFVLQELQKEQDWNWLRDRMDLAIAMNPPHEPGIQEIPFLADDIYKVCTGYNDCVRLHHGDLQMEIPWTAASSGNHFYTRMHDRYGRLDVQDNRQRAFIVGDTITFVRPWLPHEEGGLLETDIIHRLPPLHICGPQCPPACPHAYKDRVLKEVPDPYYICVRTAARRAEGDPSVTERVQSLTDEGAKILSKMRENDAAHTIPDTYQTSELGYVSVY